MPKVAKNSGPTWYMRTQRSMSAPGVNPGTSTVPVVCASVRKLNCNRVACLVPEGAKTDDEILADAKLAEIDNELAQLTAAGFAEADAAGDENYALEADPDEATK